jgi:2-iminoacetate synthase ThiH
VSTDQEFPLVGTTVVQEVRKIYDRMEEHVHAMGRTYSHPCLYRYSYRNAATRLKKQGSPLVLDVSTERLQLRVNIEQEIDAIVASHGFQRVTITTGRRTEWNRSIRLYERVTTRVTNEIN